MWLTRRTTWRAKPDLSSPWTSWCGAAVPWSPSRGQAGGIFPLAAGTAQARFRHPFCGFAVTGPGYAFGPAAAVVVDGRSQRLDVHLLGEFLVGEWFVMRKGQIRGVSRTDETTGIRNVHGPTGA